MISHFISCPLSCWHSSQRSALTTSNSINFLYASLRSISANTELWRCHIYFFINDREFSFGFFGLVQDQAMLRHARQIRGMLANSPYARNVTGRNADPRGADTQCELPTVPSQSIQTRILPLRSVFHPGNALIFSTKCKNVSRTSFRYIEKVDERLRYHSRRRKTRWSVDIKG
jgi:hypothetical protein